MDASRVVGVFLVVLGASAYGCQRPSEHIAPTPTVEMPAEGSLLPSGRACSKRSCSHPDISPTSRVRVVSLGDDKVRLRASVPIFEGVDTSFVSEGVDVMFSRLLSEHQAEWAGCEGRSGLGLGCLPWQLETTCEAVQSKSLISVVCRVGLHDTYVARPSITYLSANFVTCNGRTRVVNFSEDICPKWNCEERLWKALSLAATEQGVRKLGGDATIVRSVEDRFLLSADGILFLFGALSPHDFLQTPDTVVGHNVVALTYQDLVATSPDARAFLEDVGLLVD